MSIELGVSGCELHSAEPVYAEPNNDCQCMMRVAPKTLSTVAATTSEPFVGGCSSTEFGCCEDEETGQEDEKGTNCDEYMGTTTTEQPLTTIAAPSAASTICPLFNTEAFCLSVFGVVFVFVLVFVFVFVFVLVFVFVFVWVRVLWVRSNLSRSDFSMFRSFSGFWFIF